MFEKLATILHKEPQAPVASYTIWPTILAAVFLFVMWATVQGVNYQVQAFQSDLAISITNAQSQYDE